ncbi:MAG: 2-hydroxyglutaryl-CoA dehydratase [Thermoplasmata archaeon]|nr:2-hydroxyglutaryl-CoA dehydratase [Thermoplasmata archaeon]
MVRVGIDVGSLYTKGLVITEDPRVLAHAVEATTTDVPGLTQTMLADLLSQAGIALEEVQGVASTGQGRRRVPFADVYKTDFTAFAWGAKLLHEPVRMVIDAGGQGVRIIEMDEWGMMTNFRTNDKCSSGTGCFLDTMAYALDVELSDMGDVGRASLCAASINSSCTVFAESEVVSAVAKGESKVDIISGLNRMVAKRMASLAKTLAVRGDVVFAGGVGRNLQVVELLRERFNHRVVVPENPHMVGALGAAVLAPQERKDKGVGM